jgi:serine protease Do
MAREMLQTLARPIILPLILVLMVVGAGQKLVAQPQVPSSRGQVQLSFAPIVKQSAPAVVNIYTKKIVKQRISPLMNDPIFQQFFGNNPMLNLPRERVENALGSGVIVRSDGQIVTNYHVVEASDEITVVLADRREFTAKILYSDKRIDMALLKIEAANLPFLELADSDLAEVGDVVLAIGNPFGVGQTVTMGIVGAGQNRGGHFGFELFYPNRCGDQPGQLRWRSGGYQRPAAGHQQRDFQQGWGIQRHWLCDSRQYGARHLEFLGTNRSGGAPMVGVAGAGGHR